MEILTTITHEAGTLDISSLLLLVCLIILSILGLIMIICTISDGEVGGSIISFILTGIFMFLAIAVGTCLKYPTTYHEYDVIFTEPVDMDELSAKYEIESNNGRIWHLIEKH